MKKARYTDNKCCAPVSADFFSAVGFLCEFLRTCLKRCVFARRVTLLEDYGQGEITSLAQIAQISLAFSIFWLKSEIGFFFPHTCVCMHTLKLLHMHT